MKPFRWSEEKNALLKATRRVSFEDITLIIRDRKHRSRPHQRELLTIIDEYVYVVPYVEEEHFLFLKTLFPSRKETKIYFRNRLNYEKK
jgi:hypothetical protein